MFVALNDYILYGNIRFRLHCSVFVQKGREKLPFLWKCSHWSAQNWLKTEVLKILSKVNVHKSGSSWESSESMWTQKNGSFVKAPIFEYGLHKTGEMWTQ